jgi:type I restriction enzyme S subunit
MLLPVPPEAEQRRIAEFIASAVLHIRNSVLSAEREIALLREYRTRLIADVVTGKLDVREAAARLPVETEEPEPLDDADALAEGNEEAGADLDAATEEAEA